MSESESNEIRYSDHEHFGLESMTSACRYLAFVREVNILSHLLSPARSNLGNIYHNHPWRRSFVVAIITLGSILSVACCQVQPSNDRLSMRIIIHLSGAVDCKLEGQRLEKLMTTNIPFSKTLNNHLV